MEVEVVVEVEVEVVVEVVVEVEVELSEGGRLMWGVLGLVLIKLTRAFWQARRARDQSTETTLPCNFNFKPPHKTFAPSYLPQPQPRRETALIGRCSFAFT
jgi:hypothetical protein